MAGINGLVTVPLVASGVEIDNDQITIGGNLRYRQRTRIAGFLEAELTDVRDTTPGASDYGLVVRNIPSGTQDVAGTVAISGTVPVSGTVAISGTVPISASSLPLPTGAATATAQASLLTELQLKADLTETQPVAIAPLTSCGSGKTTVTTAGTRVALGSSTAIKSVTVKALSSNTGLLYVGTTTVAAANGFQLSAGDSVSLDVDNLTDINIDSAVNGEGVTYLWAT